LIAAREMEILHVDAGDETVLIF
jgi:hypothetical protein